MSDDYFHEGRRQSLTFWGLGQMLKGAGYAAAFLLVISLILGGLFLISKALPDASKEAPSPYGALEPDSQKGARSFV